MLQLIHVSKAFQKGTPNEINALDDISITIKQGEFITIIGSNGSGKSTLLNVISGSITIDSGDIKMGNNTITSTLESSRARFISRVFQDPQIGTSGSLSVRDNLLLAFSKTRWPNLKGSLSKTRLNDIMNWLGEIGLGLEFQLATPVDQLSGGQRQSVALIMALIRKPQVLLLDEYVAALDPINSAHILNFTARFIEENKISTLMVTHKISHALQYGSRLIILHKGRLIMDVCQQDKQRLSIMELLEKFGPLNSNDIPVSDRSLTDLF